MKKMILRMLSAAFLAGFAFLPQALAASITLVQPSAQESALAPRRDFLVIGRLEDVRRPVNVKVELYDKHHKLVRAVHSNVNAAGVTDAKDLELSYEHGKYYVDDKNASLIGNPPPDLVKGSDGKRIPDPSNKAVLNREGEFAALVMGGISKHFDTDYSDAALGPYRDLEPGKYSLKISAVDVYTGRVVAEKKATLFFRGSDDIVFGRFSPEQAEGYGHKEKLTAFAAEKKARILNDLLPGYWSRPRSGSMQAVFYEIPLRWRLNDAQEYLTASRIHGVIYNISEGSASQRVELGALTAHDYIDNPQQSHTVRFYHYDIGEVDLEYYDAANRKQAVEGKIVPFAVGADGAYRQHDVTRVEIRRGDVLTEENDYWPKENYKFVDFDIDDGVTLHQGEYISIFGVTTPVRTKDYEKGEDDDVYDAGSYMINDRIMNIRYTILTPSGETIRVDKPVGLKRHYFVNKIARSIYEYKHILGNDVLSHKGAYTVQMVGLDKKNIPVGRTAREFIVTVE